MFRARLILILLLTAVFARGQETVAPTTLTKAALVLKDGGRDILAYLDSQRQGTLASLRIDDSVLLRGIAVGQPVAMETRHSLPAEKEVRSLGVVSFVWQRRLWLGVGGAAACVMVLAAWVLGLRRSVSNQKAVVAERAASESAIREINATLEKRVADRTSDLASARDDLSEALHTERELNELKSRFVTLVSHEFRTPLGITMSAVELMRHYDEKLPAEQRKELCEDIYRATRQMGGLMEQVLVLGRVEAGKLTCRPVPIDLITLAQKLADESLSVTNRRCSIEWSALTTLEGARGDETLLRHILANLLSNAAKYSPAGGTVRFTARRDGTHCVFTVEDKGIGIPEGDREKLFDAFHRCSNVGETPGTGLGLVIVRRCVEQHGGTLDFVSRVGGGTTFTVWLPLFAGVE